MEVKGTIQCRVIQEEFRGIVAAAASVHITGQAAGLTIALQVHVHMAGHLQDLAEDVQAEVPLEVAEDVQAAVHSAVAADMAVAADTGDNNEQ